MAGPRFKPRIDDRNDKLAFTLAFVAGAGGILVVRILGAGEPLSLFDFLAVVIAVSTIAAYTIYILISTDRSSVSLDRAGDNAYYLGLLFTLISLVYSLWKVSEIAMAGGGGTTGIRTANQVLSLLPDFGLALSSTIAGIFARVIVQQFRNDPIDIEAQARQELGLAIQSLRASLLQAVSDMNSTSRSANIAITEMLTRTNKTLEESAEANLEMMSRLGHRIDEFSDHFLDQFKPISAGLKGLADELGAAVTHMKEQAVKLDFDGSPVEKGLGALSTELENMRKQVEATRNGCTTFSNELSDLATQFKDLIPGDLADQLKSSGSDLLERHGQLVSQLGTLKNDTAQLGQNLGGIGDRVSGATADLERVGAANQALASQLTDASAQLAEGQQKLLIETNSLQEKIRKTSESVERVPLGTTPRNRIREWFGKRGN